MATNQNDKEQHLKRVLVFPTKKGLKRSTSQTTSAEAVEKEKKIDPQNPATEASNG